MTTLKKFKKGQYTAVFNRVKKEYRFYNNGKLMIRVGVNFKLTNKLIKTWFNETIEDLTTF